MPFSTRLKHLRVENQMTQQMLADHINVARTTIAGYERKNRQPSHEKLTAIADVFGVTIDYLIDTKDDNALPQTDRISEQESMIDQRVLKLYRHLSANSKQDVLKYIRLLQLSEKALDD